MNNYKQDFITLGLQSKAMNLTSKTIINILFLRLTLEIIQVAPIWVTSPYLKAGFNNIIAVQTGNTSTPTATIPFTGVAFTNIPNLGYGASTYRGNDALGTQMWEINRTGLTTSSFSVLIQIVGFTNLNFLTVRFIAVDVLFPHNLNSFDNVPVNYSAGPLANISVKGTTSSPSIYTNTINFTKQSTGLQYRYFSTPFSSNKILLFMTSFFHSGSNEANITINNPIKILIDYEILNNETYKLMVSLGIKNRVDKLHFSMIVFDQADVERSGLYLLIYQRINVDYTGGFLPLPIEFLNNFIIGLTNFTTNRTKSQIQFSWTYTNFNGTDGYFMPLSTTSSTTQLPVVTLGFSYFYLKTWICPNQTFFDPSLNLCTGCPIINCKNCYNLTMCWFCDEQNGYHLNLVTGKCDYCSIVGCQNCTTLSNNTLNFSTYNYQQVCLQCNSTNSFQLLSDGTCERCKNQFNIFLNPLTLKCQQCSIQNCYICLNLEICALCDVNNSYGGDPLNNDCVYCNNSLNYFINQSDYQCTPCLLDGCKVCLSLNQCTVCNESAGYSLNSTNYLCQVCRLQNCFLCINQTFCITCLTDYFVNLTSGLCETCQLQGCLKCLDLYICLECDTINNYDFDETISNGTTCTQCNTSCKCNGYVLPWDSSNQSCNTFCGDGFIRIAQECDDNNTMDGDGCSSACTIQSNFFCSSEPSICIANRSQLFDLIKVEIKKEKCNAFSVIIYLLDADIYQLITTNNIKILNQPVYTTDIKIEPEKVVISAKYKQSLLEPIQLFMLGDEITVTFSQLLPFIFYTEDQCKSQQNIQILMQTVQMMSYILLVISLLSCKIIGLELFGVLQLSYFALIQHDFIILYLQPLTKFRTFNGLNLILLPQFSDLPEIFQLLGHQATFLNNFNLMYFLVIFQLLLSFLLYFIYKITRFDKLRNFSLRLMKQGFITLIIFNCYNFSFSTGTHFKYSEGGINYWIGVVMIVIFLILLIVSTLGMPFSNQKYYGQFMDKFKDNFLCRLYIPLTILYRLGIGLYISTTYTKIQSTLFTLAFVFIFMFYNTTNLPFKDAYQNYRSNLIHITELIILFTGNYYRSMKANTPLKIKGLLFTPGILQFVLVIACVFISIILLAYEIYLQIKKWKNTRKIKGFGNLNQLSQATLH